MGKQTRLKQKEASYKEAEFLTLFQKKNKSTVVEEDVFVNLLEPYQDFFINDVNNFNSKLKSKDTTKKFLEFISFVFKKYPVPNHFNDIWLNFFEKKVPNNICEVKAHCKSQHDVFIPWYICHATGGSVHKKYLNKFFSRQETHIFLNNRKNLSFKQNLVYAIALTESKNDKNALKLTYTKLVDLFFNELVLLADNNKDTSIKLVFLKNCIKFFSINPAENYNDVDDVVDYLINCFKENNKFNIFGQGFTFNSLQRRMIQWHHALNRSQVLGNDTWVGHPIDNQTFKDKNQEGYDIVWSFEQILTSKDLFKEGTVMHHCVYSYKERCLNGAISIWSLNKLNHYGINKKVVTIELSNSGSIVQARGFANRRVKEEERSIIAKWAKQNVLYFNLR